MCVLSARGRADIESTRSIGRPPIAAMCAGARRGDARDADLADDPRVDAARRGGRCAGRGGGAGAPGAVGASRAYCAADWGGGGRSGSVGATRCMASRREWAAAQRSARKEREKGKRMATVRQVLQSVLPVTQLRDELYAQVRPRLRRPMRANTYAPKRYAAKSGAVGTAVGRLKQKTKCGTAPLSVRNQKCGARARPRPSRRLRRRDARDSAQR